MLRHLHTVHSLDAEVCGSNDWCAAKGITKRLVDIPDGTGVTPLMYAGSNAHEDAVGLLIESGADLNLQDSHEWTAISWTTTNGHAQVVRMIAQAGCDLDIVDMWGNAPLHWAARNGYEACARELMNAKADARYA